MTVAADAATIKDVDDAMYVRLTTPAITTTLLGTLAVDGNKPPSERKERTGTNGQPYQLWIRRVGSPEPSEEIGSLNDTRYEVATTSGGNPATYREFEQGSHFDLVYEIRYAVRHEDDDRELQAALAWRFRPKGSRITGPAGGKFLAFRETHGPIPELDRNKIGFMMRVRVKDIVLGRVDVGDGIPAILPAESGIFPEPATTRYPNT